MLTGRIKCRTGTTKPRVNFRSTMVFSSIWNLSATPASASVVSWGSPSPAPTSKLWTARTLRPASKSYGASARVATGVSRIPSFAYCTTPPPPRALTICSPYKAERPTRQSLRIRIKSGSGRIPGSSRGWPGPTSARCYLEPMVLNCVPVRRRRSRSVSGRWRRRGSMDAMRII